MKIKQISKKIVDPELSEEKEDKYDKDKKTKKKKIKLKNKKARTNRPSLCR